MLFNNSSNKIRIIGFLVSEVKILNAYAIEFLIAVPRKVKKESKVLMMCSLYMPTRQARSPLQKSFAQRLCSSCKGRTEDLYGQISEDMQQ